MQTDIRPLTLVDLPAAMELENSMLGSLMFFPANEKELTSLINDGLEFGIFDNNQLIGKVGFLNLGNEGFEVDGMILNKDWRNKGIGKKLFSYALKELMNKVHPTKVFLFTHPDNSGAIALYQKFGFITKELIPNKYGKGMHRIRMEKLYKSR